MDIKDGTFYRFVGMHSKIIIVGIFIMFVFFASGCSDISEKDAKKIIENTMDVYVHNNYDDIDTYGYYLEYPNGSFYDLRWLEGQKRYAIEPTSFFFKRMSSVQKNEIMKLEEQQQQKLKYSIKEIKIDGKEVEAWINIQRFNGEVLNDNIKELISKKVMSNKNYITKMHRNGVSKDSIKAAFNAVPMTGSDGESYSSFFGYDDVIDIAYESYIECIKNISAEDKVIYVKFVKVKDNYYRIPERDYNYKFGHLYNFMWYRYSGINNSPE